MATMSTATRMAHLAVELRERARLFYSATWQAAPTSFRCRHCRREFPAGAQVFQYDNDPYRHIADGWCAVHGKAAEESQARERESLLRDAAILEG